MPTGGLAPPRPVRGTGVWARRVYRSTISAFGAATATRASSGCRPPPPPVRTAGTRRRRRHANNPCWANVVAGVVRKARFALARPGRHRLLGPACLRSITSAYGRTLAAVVPRTGIEPVISSLRGRRVGHSTNGAGQAGAGSRCPGGPARPGWSLSGSNRPPPLCKRGALPDELRPQGRTGPPGDGAAQRSGRWWRARVPPPAPWGYEPLVVP